MSASRDRDEPLVKSAIRDYDLMGCGASFFLLPGDCYTATLNGVPTCARRLRYPHGPIGRLTLIH
jgi:hypothetical protein